MTGAALTTAFSAPRKNARRSLARKPSRIVSWVAEHTLLAFLLVLFAAPIVFVALTSFMTDDQALTSALWPSPWSVESYVEAFERVPLVRWFANSALYALVATAFMLLSSVPASYALARLRFRGANVLFVAIVVAMLLPPQITAVPLYVMWVKAGMTGSLLPLILPNLLGDAFSIFLLRQFFLTIPREYSDAARVDGASEWGILWRVVIPMARPGIAAAALFLFFHSWNDYYGPLAVHQRESGLVAGRLRTRHVPRQSQHQLEPDHGHHDARDDPRGAHLLLRPTRVRRGHHTDRRQGTE